VPELEVFKRYVDSTYLHQNIETIGVQNGKVLDGHLRTMELGCGPRARLAPGSS